MLGCSAFINVPIRASGLLKTKSSSRRSAGGIAHDFNNMIGVILGYSELIKPKLSPNDPLLQEVNEIEMAANRSRDTARQLLAF